MNVIIKYVTRQLFIVLFLLLSTFGIAEQYQISTIEYEIEGKTRKYPLSQAVEIDTDRIFTSFQAIEAYLTDLQVQFQNQRVLESAFITPTYGQPNEQNIIPVDLLITTVDSGSVFALPFPRIDSNSGVEFRLKLKDYNFLGSLKPLDLEFNYQYDTDTGTDAEPDRPNEHIFGGLVSFSIPFELGIFDANWSNRLGLDYTIGHPAPKVSFSTGLSFNYEINDVIALNFGITQGITYDPGYKEYGDAFYLTEQASFAIPITLARTDNFGNISWRPSISVTYYWDTDGINEDNEDLIDIDDIHVGHSFSFGRTNWIGNFREGFSFSVNQALSQQTGSNQFSISSSLSAAFYRAFEYVGINTRIYIFEEYNDTSEVGGRVRGILNHRIDTDSALIFNFDLPIKVWQTDWVGYGLWEWTEFFDFELQISPFIDIAIGNNNHPDANSSYDYKDGWYGAGLEILGFLNQSRSVVGRISFGIDVVQFAERVGNRIDFIDKVVNNLFNTSWRSGDWYEFSFGLGLYY